MPEYSILLESKISLEKNFFWLHLFDLDLVSWDSDVQMKSKNTSMWIIRIKLKCFCWKKTFSWEKRKEYIDDWTDLLWENKIIGLCITNNIIKSGK